MEIAARIRSFEISPVRFVHVASLNVATVRSQSVPVFAYVALWNSPLVALGAHAAIHVPVMSGGWGGGGTYASSPP